MGDVFGSFVMVSLGGVRKIFFLGGAGEVVVGLAEIVDNRLGVGGFGNVVEMSCGVDLADSICCDVGRGGGVIELVQEIINITRSKISVLSGGKLEILDTEFVGGMGLVEGVGFRKRLGFGRCRIVI